MRNCWYRIQAALRHLLQGRTSLVIAHRLPTIQGADQIAVLERGQLVEIGTHTELLAQGNGMLSSMICNSPSHPR
uniref:hypothetical protein n=1 Tax=Petrachloros mirabilis TaxID=2918835 RepID=UPI0030845529